MALSNPTQQSLSKNFPNSFHNSFPVPVQRLLTLLSREKVSREAEEFAEFGKLLMALSASKAKGLSLVLGAENGTNLAWIISGLPNDGKLLATSQNEEKLETLRAAVDTDLRVAFHFQETENFVRDIAHHRFDLIYCGHGLSDDISQVIQTMLMPGGFLIANPIQNAAVLSMSDEVASLIPLPAPLDKEGLKLYVKGERPLKRRGGRKAKLDRPSLRSA